jgi:hypothetical protein
MGFLNESVTELAVEFAGGFYDWRNGWVDYDKVRDAYEELMERFNVFSQVRGTQGPIEKMEAVFYAGKAAWRNGCDPFLVIPLSEFE